MAKPSRPSNAENRSGKPRTFFVTSQTASGRSILQSERMAELFIEVLRSCMRAAEMQVHEFVVMPNHVHILMTIPGDISVEKAVQLIKGRFSFRAARELDFKGEIWKRGFSDVRITNDKNFAEHCRYIAENPVKAGLAKSAEGYPFGSVCLKLQKKMRTGEVDEGFAIVGDSVG